VDAATLVKAMPGLDLPRASQLVNGANAAMVIGEITNVRRAAMFLAQIGHESGSLRYKQEIQPPPGATYPPYIGRTFIQITWDYNYAAFGQWCARKNLLNDPNLFLNHPPTLAADQWAWLGPVWYWTVSRPQLNTLSDQGDIVGATRAINGGLNGLADRTTRYKHCLSLGTAILPTSPVPTPPPEVDMPAQLYLTASAKKPTKVPAAPTNTYLQWDGWNPTTASGGASAILPNTARFISLTAWLYVAGLGPDGVLYVQVQNLDRGNNQKSIFPRGQLLAAPTASSEFVYSQVGTVGDKTNLRLLVSASKAATVTRAWWRILYW
jgi:predicted chitinase